MKITDNKQMTLTMKIATIACSAIMLFVLSVPIWRIDLTAPQYPEGLTLTIWANKLGNDVDVINGLNHYIGMHTLHAKDFIEFTVLPYIIIGYSLLGVLTLVLNRRRVFNAWFYLFVIVAIVAMADFYKWEYQYGHDLDPTAPIKVPDMAYQPPLIGYKQLLNFSAYSIPATGGWLFILVGVILGTTWFFNWRSSRSVNKLSSHKLKKSHKIATAMIALFMLFITSCSREPQSISYGKDNCDFCKMTIMDRRFSSEIITKKGKVFKFDDAHCLESFLKSESISKKEVYDVYFSDFSGNDKWLSSGQCIFLNSEQFHSPMGGNIAAFSSREKLDSVKKRLEGQEILWKDFGS